MDNKSRLLNDEWANIQKKVIRPLWNLIFKSKYELLKMDYNDFESMAGYELSKAIKTFDPSKSSLRTFANNVVTRKAKTELRDHNERDKRKSLHTAYSLNKSVSNDDDTEMINFIQDGKVEDNSDINKVKRYINKLSSIEKDIIIYNVLGFTKEDVVEFAGVNKKTYEDALKSMKLYEKLSLLRNRGVKNGI